MPAIKGNLLFVECISDQGYSLELIQNICMICDITTKQILGKFERIGKKGLYRLQAESVSSAMICSLEEKQNNSQALLWHITNSHLGPDGLAPNLCHLGRHMG